MAEKPITTELVRKFLLFSLLLIAILQLGVYAVSVTGVSHIVLQQNSSSVYQNNSLAIPFSVNLTTGSSGTVYVVVNNSQALKSKGIFVGLNKSIGTPNFTDTLFINTNFDSVAVPGVYEVEIGVGGADPLNPEFANFTLTVLNIIKPTTTVQTTIPGTSNTAASVSAVTATEERNIAIVFIVAVVVIILLIVINKIRS